MGLLDGLNMNDPQTMGLLGAAAQMLQASGPSLMPHSFGQVMGAGVQGLVQGQQTGLDRQKEKMQMDMLTQQVAQATRKNDMVNAFIAKRMGLDGQPQPQSGQPAQTPPMIPMGGTDADGRTISTPGFFAPGGASPAAGSATPTGGGMQVPDDAIMWNMAGFPDIGKMVNERTMPTDLIKTATQLNIPLSTVRDSQLADMASKGITAVRAGGTLFQNGKPIFSAPTTDGQFTTWGAQGNPSSALIPGAADTNQALEYSRSLGKAFAKPMTAYVDGKPVFTNEGVAANGGIDPRAPVWTGGTLAPDYLAELQSRAQAGEPKAKMILDAYNGAKQTPLVPDLAPGVKESQGALALSGAKRYNDLITLASDSPTRVNVYDNILNLSHEGVKTGPGSEWQNKVKGYIANTPMFSGVTKDWQNDVAGFQEITKFMYQNAQRAWQAAGGTGTDAQLDAATKSNMNNTMFPQALQKIGEWGKAGELALQGKTNAMQSWKDANGGNVANQDQFERAWRNNFDPLLFQLKTMDPAQAASMVADMKAKNPNAYATLMMKARALTNMGGL